MYTVLIRIPRHTFPTRAISFYAPNASEAFIMAQSQLTTEKIVGIVPQSFERSV
jgi:hypothetical protein